MQLRDEVVHGFLLASESCSCDPRGKWPEVGVAGDGKL